MRLSTLRKAEDSLMVTMHSVPIADDCVKTVEIEYGPKDQVAAHQYPNYPIEVYLSSEPDYECKDGVIVDSFFAFLYHFLSLADIEEMDALKSDIDRMFNTYRPFSPGAQRREAVAPPPSPQE